MIVEKFEPFVGQHCETTATGSLLNQLGIHFSEPMLFGLGEGFGFIFWNSKQMGFLFLGGRVKPMGITRNLAVNLKLELEVNETSSLAKAWKRVSETIKVELRGLPPAAGRTSNPATNLLGPDSGPPIRDYSIPFGSDYSGLD